ncbi:CHRD domain-containing protein [Polluticoccus soli]|uniref:CHRD domain-containing protein n=1 Tax=Polluticoccus soli TaxID=3034150 RepID=UPI0023E19BC8|nr:CHRD domain-containing protein [Flavipsychrobacter sp. JY13-12]
MKRFTQLALALAVMLFFFKPASADHLTAKYLFAAKLDGAQEVPSVPLNGLGVATLFVSYDLDSACLEMTVNGLSGPITAVHIHAGPVGVSGPVVVDLMPYLTGNRVKATITGATVNPQLMANLLSGMFYINVHTALYPNGEIRGQLLPEEDKGITTWLQGIQETPPVATSGTGLGSFILSKSMQKLSFHVVVNGLSSAITGAHLHRQASGYPGPIVEDLTPFINGNVISGNVDPTLYLSSLLADSIYINVHTVSNPGGEIRGQLLIRPYLYYDAPMDTMQEANVVTGNATLGLTTLKLNYTLDTLWYDAQLTGLTGAIQAAHFHSAGLGVAGPIVIGIPNPNITGSTISGYVAGTDLVDSVKRQLLEGGIYFNVHTVANPAGEARGQVYRSYREGYTCHINGSQQVPPVSSGASGTGMVSIDRDQTNAHYMFGVNALTNYTASHFHNHIAGQNGPIIFDFSSQYNNGGVFGYWDENSTPAFDTVMSNKFRKDSMYVNFHTTANPNGEVRGNLTRKLCNDIVNGIDIFGSNSVSVNLYPNPASEGANLDIMLEDATQIQVQLTDMLGKTIWIKSADLTGGQNRVTIPMASLASGVYFVNIYNTEGQMAYKLIKE